MYKSQVLDRAIQGIRRAESAKRAENYKEPEICRAYSKKERVRVYLPILEWTDEDVERFISERGIKCHPLYYDEQGRFHVERRLGCVGCPMRSDKGKADYLKYPKMLKQLIRAAQTFIDTHPESSSRQKFGDAYHMVLHNLFCNSYEEYRLLVTGGMFPETAIDPKSELEQFFRIKL